MTDSSGQTETVELEAPPVEYSMEPTDEQPYSEYNLRINAPGYEPLTVSGAQIFSGQLALQNQGMLLSAQAQGDYRILAIGPHTLFGEYPPKIAENEIKDIQATGEVVLSRVVVPEFMVVHDGAPSMPRRRITIFNIEITLKMWLPARSTPHGRRRPCGPIFLPSCLSL